MKTGFSEEPDAEKGNVSLQRQPETSAVQPAPGYWSVLRNRNFALLFWGQLISTAGTQMQIIAVSWQVYELTHSAVALGAIGLLQAIPRLLFSLLGGVFADRFDRRKMLLLIEVMMALLSAVLAVTTAFKVINISIVYAVVLISAFVSAFEFPARQAMIPTLVPRSQIASAVSLSMVVMQLTVVIGSAAGGYVLGQLGVVATYWIDVFSYAVVIGSLLLLVVPAVERKLQEQSSIAALRDGLRYLWQQPIILGVLTIDFFATFLGSPKALYPVYANDILHVGAQGLGVLVAATSIGAIVLTPFTGLIQRIRRQGLGVFLAVLVWGLCIILFGILPGPLWLSVLFLAGAGAADMVSMILRGLIVQLTTPDEYRGRINAVNAMFVIGGPMLGQFESGMVAGLATPQISVVSGGIGCMLATVLVAVFVPSLLKIKAK